MNFLSLLSISRTKPSKNQSYIRFGLNHSFENKSRYIKLNLATEIEFLFTQVKDDITSQQ